MRTADAVNLAGASVLAVASAAGVRVTGAPAWVVVAILPVVFLLGVTSFQLYDIREKPPRQETTVQNRPPRGPGPSMTDIIDGGAVLVMLLACIGFVILIVCALLSMWSSGR